MTFLPSENDQKTFPGQVDPTEAARRKHDSVDHPEHYTTHPSGVECIEITEHMNFCLGNAVKYLWRAGSKGPPAQHIEDLRKAVWYIEREIARLDPPPVELPITPTGSTLFGSAQQALQQKIRVSGVPYPVDLEDIGD